MSDNPVFVLAATQASANVSIALWKSMTGVRQRPTRARSVPSHHNVSAHTGLFFPRGLLYKLGNSSVADKPTVIPSTARSGGRVDRITGNTARARNLLRRLVGYRRLVVRYAHSDVMRHCAFWVGRSCLSLVLEWGRWA